MISSNTLFFSKSLILNTDQKKEPNFKKIKSEKSTAVTPPTPTPNNQTVIPRTNTKPHQQQYTHSLVKNPL